VVRRPVRRADKLTTLMCRLSRNPGALTSRTPQGHVGLFRGYFNFTFTFTLPMSAVWSMAGRAVILSVSINEMGRACGAYVGGERCVQDFGGEA
jgi:hypothetical protein